MNTLFARLIAWLAGLGFLAFGAMFVWDPLGTMALAGLQWQGDLAATELRAFYGGLEIALGLLICGMARSSTRLPDALALSAACYGGIGSARLLGIVLAASSTPFLNFALATELGLCALSLWARHALRSPE